MKHRIALHYQSGMVHTMDLKPPVAANVLSIAEDVWSGRRHGSTAVKLTDEDTGLQTLINLKRIIHIQDLGPVAERVDVPPAGLDGMVERQFAEDARPWLPQPWWTRAGRWLSGR